MNPIVIRLGGYQKPASVHTRAAVRFGQVLEQTLGDLVRFELVGDVLALGRKSGDLPRMVESGELSLCYISTVRFTPAVPEFRLLELPFVVPDRFQAQDNPLTNIFNFGVHRHHRHITLSGHFFGMSALVCNAAHYGRWPPAVQAAVEAAAVEATALQRQLAAAEDAKIMAQLDPRQNDIIPLSDAERTAFVQAVWPVRAKYRGELDPHLFELLR